MDVLLQSPSGQNVILMSDVGGFVSIPNATYTFDDAGPAMNATAANPTGTYHPTNKKFPCTGPPLYNTKLRSPCNSHVWQHSKRKWCLETVCV
ncbi:MAG: hypothetical protein R2765_05990 [Ferruginibacter sp.]